MAFKNRRKRRSKAKSKSPRKKTGEIEISPTLSLEVDEEKEPVEPQFEESQLEESQPEEPEPEPPSTATPTTEALASMSAQNLYHLSLVCFAISFVLFVSTYNMIANNGGTIALLGGNATSIKTTLPAKCPVVEVPSPSVADVEHDELLIGYKILHHTLKKESQLKYLHWLRDATFRGPKGSLKSAVTTVYKTSKTRFHELEQLFVDESPTIRLKDAPKSAMGDSIQDDVEQTSTGELVPLPFSSLSPSSPKHLQWGVRFVLIQAQATRMVVALSTSLMKFETSPERKQWLSQLADEFEGIRETLVENILLNLGEGSWKE
mmetsp:Transcript_16617/g.41636  ORF Transcript_16617/g.41636 Transcript_16617/m.41636 type:complete len:320 (+) Transcript_16617:204-1163(+)|eukprot:CAMPEP_0116099852 /NCGR_PEP_ID=MMETSP0327-20121206/11987_1 /TAXON_ID=44447 /ORGANISM="Pseudo-nitzschia delicatissima, Strain B596" /LENGTH=319 /DNA_ID=CAMNT_0003591753 /DNA_START=356 /DNA_END=1315 /DNA_ORIENTATION=+